jgi:hypothetical protein
MTTENDSISVVHNDEADRYELYVAGEMAAIADYRRQDGTLVMHHTETRPQYRGRGLAARLVREALDDVRQRKLHVVPSCWFVGDFIEANPDYRDLVA